jgi:hypothetical protein
MEILKNNLRRTFSAFYRQILCSLSTTPRRNDIKAIGTVELGNSRGNLHFKIKPAAAKCFQLSAFKTGQDFTASCLVHAIAVNEMDINLDNQIWKRIPVTNHRATR